MIAQKLMGAETIDPCWRRFKIDPQYVTFGEASLSFLTLSGTVSTAFKRDKAQLTMSVGVPAKTEALVYIPSTATDRITIDGRALRTDHIVTDAQWAKAGKTAVWLRAGNHEIRVAK